MLAGRAAIESPSLPGTSAFTLIESYRSKLRLFLKLVSQVDGGRELEPLPDIDFNIRAGNTLVGFATEAQFDASGSLASDLNQRAEIKASTADLADAFDFFRQQQTVHGGLVTADDKRKLRDKLSGLSLELDKYLAVEYGVDPAKPPLFAAWRASHQPFHWFAEFYGVMREGGFDVVIGNPPYVATRKVTEYTVQGYQTATCTDIYAWCLERTAVLLHQSGFTGMIVPLSLAFSVDFRDMRTLSSNEYERLWISTYAKRPSMLFTGVQIRCVIQLSARTGAKIRRTTRIHRWYEPARGQLFDILSYCVFNSPIWSGFYPKLPTTALIQRFEKCLASGVTLGSVIARRPTKFVLFFKKSVLRWQLLTMKFFAALLHAGPGAWLHAASHSEI